MKKLFFLLLTTSLLCFSCYTYQPAVNYCDQPTPYTLEITFDGGIKDTINNVWNFKNYRAYDNIIYIIKICNPPHPKSMWPTLKCKSIQIQNVNSVRILNN